MIIEDCDGIYEDPIYAITLNCDQVIKILCWFWVPL